MNNSIVKTIGEDITPFYEAKNIADTDFLVKALDSFIAYIRVNPESSRTYIKALKKFFLYLMNNKINRPIREDIYSYIDSLKAEGLKASTISLYVVAIKRLYSYLEEDFNLKNIARGVKSEKVDKLHKKDWLIPAQIKNILNTMDINSNNYLRDKAIFLLTLSAGLRTIEVSRLNKSDISTRGGEAVLYVLGKGKTDKEAIVIDDSVIPIVNEYLDSRTDDNEALFVSNSRNKTKYSNERLSVKSVYKILKGLMVKAGYNSERLTPHSLRKTSISLALLSGASERAVTQFARHSSFNTTLIYAGDIERIKNKTSSQIIDYIRAN